MTKTTSFEYNSIVFLNHTSVLLIGDESYVLTDPWINSYAFETWKSSPPVFLNPLILRSFLRQLVKDQKLLVVISHGHDDHCDDHFLSELPADTPVVIPKFKSPGFRKRIVKSNKTVIHELVEELAIYEWTFSAHIFEDHSHDDAVIEIRNKNFYFLHGNDNSIDFDNKTVETIRRNSESYILKYYASQTNIANPFPYRYPQLFDDYQIIAREKIKNTISRIVKNSSKIGIHNLISYAGYTSSYVLKAEKIETFFPSPRNVNQLMGFSGSDGFLDFEPGDRLFVNGFIQKSFYSNELERISIDNEDLFVDIKSHSSHLTYWDDSRLQNALNEFLEEFSNFYKQRYDSFDPIISARAKCKSLKFVLEDRGLSAEVILGDSSRDVVDNFEEIEVQSDVFIKVIERTVNLESIYIGFLGRFYRYPIEEYNHDVVHLLNSFGYKYMNSLKV